MPGRVVKGTVLLTMGKIGQKIIAVAYVLVVANALLPSEYGLVSLMTGIIMTAYVVFRGLSEACVKYIAEQPKNYKRARRILLEILKFKSLIGFLTFFLVFMLSESLGMLIFNKPEIITPLRVLALYLLVNPIYDSFAEFFQGTMNYAYMVLSQLVWYVFNLAGAVVLLMLGFGLYGVIYSFVGATILGVLASFILIRRYVQSSEGRDASLPSHRGIILYASFSTSYKIIINISEQMPILFLGVFALSHELGYFSLAQGVASVVSILSVSLAASLFPAFSESWAIRNEERLSYYFLRSIKYIFSFSLVICIWLAIFSEPLLNTFFPKYGAAFIFLSTSTWVFLFFSLGSVWGALLRGMGKLDLAVKVGLVILAPYAILCAVLTLHYGGLGAIVSLLVWTVATNLMLTIFSPIKLSLPKTSLIRAMTVSTFSTVLVVLLSRMLLTVSSILALIVSAIAGGAVYVISLALTGGFDEYDLKIVSDLAKGNKILEAADQGLRWLVSRRSKHH